MAKPEDTILADPALRGALPKSFMFGASTASYQIEGAPDADGKGPSVWDVLLKDKENGDDACNSYTLWREDIKLLKKYGADTYRFSISWPRIFPDGDASGTPNEAGIKYYSDIVDACLAEGITPFITIFHWDMPQALDDKYGGFEDVRVVDDFVGFAKVLFERLGDRVTHWITINEPFIWTMLNSAAVKKNSWNDDKWAAFSKQILLCHGRTVELYRTKYAKEGSMIGITLNMDYVVPFDDSADAKRASQEIIDLWLGMYADPIYKGHFPASCLERFGKDKLSFTDEEWKVVKGSNDFFGLNHYSTAWTTGRPTQPSDPRKAFGPWETVKERDGKPIGNKGHNGHPYDVPWGFALLLKYISDKYTKAAGQGIYVTENGFAVQDEADMSRADACNDTQRQEYFAGYLKAMIGTMKEGVDVRGYMAWSLADNLEWTAGYAPRFGLTAVDRKTGERFPKDSGEMLGRLFKYLRA